jgi:hypothetical protein
MLLAILALLTGLSISGVAIYYSVAGLVSIFAAMPIPIIVMGVSLESAKLVATVWLKQNWDRAPLLLKTYLIIAVVILMAITSMGIFGYLSKAHSDQTLVSGDVMAKLSVFDEKIKVEKDTIETDRRALKQMDEAVDQIMSRSNDEKGASKASTLRQSQTKERQRLLAEIDKANKNISAINEQRAPIAAENRKVEAEVGPIKYIAALLYGDNPDANLLEKAVRWVIIMIVIVFDPLAVILLLASQYSFSWAREDAARQESPEPEAKPEEPITVEDIKNDPELKEFFDRSKEVAKALDAGEPIPYPTTIISDVSTPEEEEAFKAIPTQATVPEVTWPVVSDYVEPKADSTKPVNVVEAVPTGPSPEHLLPTDPADIPSGMHPADWAHLVHEKKAPPEDKPDDVIEDMGIDAWNKMLEAQALKEAEERRARQNLTDVIEPELKFQSYVQNEEQKTSNVWNTTVAPISSLEYEKTSAENHIKELIENIEKGTVDVASITENDRKAIEDYLAKNK